MADIIVTEKDAARFWAKTLRNERTGCLEWAKHRNRTGYGHMKIRRNEQLAHRIAWVLHNGSLPDGLFVLHHCDNPACVEISHLFLGDHRANMADMAAKGRSRRGPNFLIRRRRPGVARGERSGPAKLTDDSVRAIRTACASGEPEAIVGARYGVTQSNVSNIIHRKTWRHVQ